MNPAVEALARAVLYEGYSLYPYRASAIKNRSRWSPGGLVPRGYSEANGGSEPSDFQAECLAEHDAEAEISVRIRFLHSMQQCSGEPTTRLEAVEREVTCSLALSAFADQSPVSRSIAFSFPAEASGGRVQYAIEGTVALATSLVAEHLHRVTIRVCNHSPLDWSPTTDRTRIELQTFASAHAILSIRNGSFISLTDPPSPLCAHAAACRNRGVWPVLVGESGNRETMLACPIILPDYPQIAAESCGDFFDSAEIDEMLTLRILTLTEAEKREMASDPQSRALLQRIETLPHDAILGMHGAIRPPSAAHPHIGDRVRLRPQGRADAFDILLTGKVATIVSIEVDFEDTTLLAVTVDDDPGQDLGAGGMPGHRFFFRPDEVERI